jgi:RHS repeat-associated protein
MYGYGAIYQLLQVTQGGTTDVPGSTSRRPGSFFCESYTYDPVGNRLSSLGVSPYSYNPSNEMVSTPTAMYVYDSNGNMTSKTDTNGTTNYAWDYENRLAQVTLPGSGGTATFKYDTFGRRIYKSSSAGTSIFAYDGDNLGEEMNASGAVVARYTQGQNIDEPLAMSRSGVISYYEADGLGSVTSMTSGSGALAQTYTFDSFGKLTNSAGSLTNPFQYTAREFDSETGLYYYRARYYDDMSGRLLSEDPIRFDAGINFYAYVSNNPLNLNDPRGLLPSGIGPEGCSYYDKRCKGTCPVDSYTCRAAKCCRSFGDSPKANCTRECLIDWDIANCAPQSGSARGNCRVTAHVYCYAKCHFFPNPLKLDSSCWSIAGGR